MGLVMSPDRIGSGPKSRHGAAWPRSIARGDLDPAKRQSEVTVAFELAPTLADEGECYHHFTAGTREVDPNLLPSVGTLLDASSFERPGRTRHGSRSWIESCIAVVCRHSAARP